MNPTNIQKEAKAYEDKMNKRFKFIKKTNVLRIDKRYELDLDRINNKHDLIGWVHHMACKTWFDNFMVKELIERVCKIKGWNIYTPSQ